MTYDLSTLSSSLLICQNCATRPDLLTYLTAWILLAWCTGIKLGIEFIRRMDCGNQARACPDKYTNQQVIYMCPSIFISFPSTFVLPNLIWLQLHLVFILSSRHPILIFSESSKPLQISQDKVVFSPCSGFTCQGFGSGGLQRWIRWEEYSSWPMLDKDQFKQAPKGPTAAQS